MNRASDGRRAKNRQRNQSQIPLIEQLKIQMEQRPQALFDKGDVVKTPIGYRRIESRYHSTGWQYQVVVKVEYKDRPRPEFIPFKEWELQLPDFYLGQVLRLSSISEIEKPISHIGLSPKNELLIGFEIRPKYWSWHCEEYLYERNPHLITSQYALQKMFLAYGKNIGSKEQAMSYCLSALPELANF